jgi:hypothetical protein
MRFHNLRSWPGMLSITARTMKCGRSEIGRKFDGHAAGAFHEREPIEPMDNILRFTP